ALDPLLAQCLAHMRTDVTGALASGMGALLANRSGAAALAHVARLAAEATGPCPVLEAAFGGLLAVRLHYRTHLHPRVRAELNPLDLAGGTGVPAVLANDPAPLYRTVAERAERAAGNVRAHLLAEAALPGRIVFAAVEEFTDALLGSVAAEQEFRYLA